MALGGGAIFGGALLSWLILPTPDIICITFGFKTLALRVRILGAVVGYFLNFIIVNFKLNSLKFYNCVLFIGSMWFLPFLSTYPVRLRTLNIGNYYAKIGDFGWSEYYGGQGAYKSIIKNSNYLQLMQDNRFKVYILSFVIWLLGVFILI